MKLSIFFHDMTRDYRFEMIARNRIYKIMDTYTKSSDSGEVKVIINHYQNSYQILCNVLPGDGSMFHLCVQHQNIFSALQKLSTKLRRVLKYRFNTKLGTRIKHNLVLIPTPASPRIEGQWAVH